MLKEALLLFSSTFLTAVLIERFRNLKNSVTSELPPTDVYHPEMTDEEALKAFGLDYKFFSKDFADRVGAASYLTGDKGPIQRTVSQSENIFDNLKKIFESTPFAFILQLFSGLFSSNKDAAEQLHRSDGTTATLSDMEDLVKWVMKDTFVDTMCRASLSPGMPNPYKILKGPFDFNKQETLQTFMSLISVPEPPKTESALAQNEIDNRVKSEESKAYTVPTGPTPAYSSKPLSKVKKSFIVLVGKYTKGVVNLPFTVIDAEVMNSAQRYFLDSLLGSNPAIPTSEKLDPVSWAAIASVWYGSVPAEQQNTPTPYNSAPVGSGIMNSILEGSEGVWKTAMYSFAQHPLVKKFKEGDKTALRITTYTDNDFVSSVDNKSYPVETANE